MASPIITSVGSVRNGSINAEFGSGIIKTVKQITNNNNIAVGFGISDRSHVKLMIDAGADGVIVGSAIVNLIGNERTGLKKRMFSYANLLKKACKLQQ